MRAFLILSVIAALLLALLGCTTYTMKGTFHESEFEPYRGTGTGRIEGQAFLKTKGGEVRFGAGNDIVLLPMTTYTEELYDAVNKGRRINAASIDRRVTRYARKTMADGNGNFAFSDLPSGQYYLLCEIKWYVSRYRTSGATIMVHTMVSDGQTSKVLLTR